MNPSSGETSEMKLPPPQMEQAPIGAAPEAPGQAAPEQSKPAGPERATNPTAAAPAAMPSIPLPATPTMLAPATQAPPAQAGTPPTASLQASDDNDLIEKEWVNKAKQIVERTRDDPHRQTEELTLVKVDYMKKRYNKTIKLNK